MDLLDFYSEKIGLAYGLLKDNEKDKLSPWFLEFSFLFIEQGGRKIYG
jgi:hypothetical protein